MPVSPAASHPCCSQGILHVVARYKTSRIFFTQGPWHRRKRGGCLAAGLEPRVDASGPVRGFTVCGARKKIADIDAVGLENI